MRIGLDAEVRIGLAAEVRIGLAAEVRIGLYGEVRIGLDAEVGIGLAAEVRIELAAKERIGLDAKVRIGLATEVRIGLDAEKKAFVGKLRLLPRIRFSLFYNRLRCIWCHYFAISFCLQKICFCVVNLCILTTLYLLPSMLLQLLCSLSHFHSLSVELSVCLSFKLPNPLIQYIFNFIEYFCL